MKKDSLGKVAFFLSSGLMVFAYGVAVGAYEIFPFSALRFGINSVQEVWSERNTLLKIRPEEHLFPARYDGESVTRIEERLMSPGLTLLSGFFGTSNELRLVQPDGAIVNRWPVKFSQLFPNTDHIQPKEMVPATDWNVDLHGAVALPDGSVLFNFEFRGLVKLDRCGEVQWTLPQMTHHSVEPSKDGSYWVGGLRYLGDRAEHPLIYEDTMLKVSASGEVLKEISVPGLFSKTGLESLLLATGDAVAASGEMEVTHLNDIEELGDDLESHFPLFSGGDLLASLRDLNLVVVLDPNTETIKWHQTGPWLRQHDPDFMRGGMISVFDNNADADAGKVFRGSHIIEIDPVGRRFSILYGGEADQRFSTAAKGNHQHLENGNILIVESESGRVFEVTRDGQIVWEFINRYDEDEVARISDGIRYPEDYFAVESWSCDASGME